jgi:hypothetical protein
VHGYYYIDSLSSRLRLTKADDILCSTLFLKNEMCILRRLYETLIEAHKGIERKSYQTLIEIGKQNLIEAQNHAHI